MAVNWTCPFCNRDQTVTKGQSVAKKVVLSLEKHRFGNIGVSLAAHACANSDCQEVAVSVVLISGDVGLNSSGQFFSGATEIISSHRLRPSSLSKPQPNYIPQPLREDYDEACKIRDLSPKASATLSRRCLQGMIREFCGISKNRLIDEIVELRKRLDAGTAPQGVTAESVDAIDYVRSIGNIGAHMEKDIDLIIPVDPNEAQALIELLELLFDEWYVARYKRQQRLMRVKAIADDKAALKSPTAQEMSSRAG
ncbi:DUF4145 domain-containing protein [Brevundimonas sp.]|uniref:DUF4145 domain-containing protein n=1 Tax=Brevundimonas sp. TaxID=1871086 RepID=UPI0028AA4C50|nr:DUF4145 domain-containing protein [Brevundimonas sp.]